VPDGLLTSFLCRAPLPELVVPSLLLVSLVVSLLLPVSPVVGEVCHSRAKSHITAKLTPVQLPFLASPALSPLLVSLPIPPSLLQASTPAVLRLLVSSHHRADKSEVHMADSRHSA
jgi:hypothetical protein